MRPGPVAAGSSRRPTRSRARRRCRRRAGHAGPVSYSTSRDRRRRRPARAARATTRGTEPDASTPTARDETSARRHRRASAVIARRRAEGRRTAPPLYARGCGSCSGTATCSAGRARTSTRGRSPGSGRRAGHEVTVVCQERHPERVRPRRRARRAARAAGRAAAGVRARPLRGARAAAAAGLHARASASATSRRTRPRCASSLPADLVFANHVLLGGPVGAASGAALRGQGARLRARVLDARAAGARGVGAGVARRRAAVFVGSAHIRARARGGRRPRRPRARGAAGRRRGRVPAASRATRRSPALLEEARRDPPNPGNREERLPDEGNAERLAEFFAGDEPTVVYFGKLLDNKGVHLLLEALREVDARARDRRLRRLPRASSRRLAPPRTLFTGPLEHRHLVHLLPLCDVAVVPSIFPEAFGMVAAEAAAAGLPAARRAALGPRRDRRRARGRRTRRSCASWPRFATGDAADLAAKLARAARALARASARRSAPPRGRPSVERWSWAGVADRLLAGRNSASADGRRAASQPGRAARVRARAVRRPARDFTLAVEEEFALLDPETLELVNRFEELQAAVARARRSRSTSSAS